MLTEKLKNQVYKGNIEFFIEDTSEDRVLARMPVNPGILNPFGIVHAGAMLWFADVAASLLAAQRTKPDDDGRGFPLAIDLHTTLLGNQSDGELRAEAKFVRAGKRVLVVRTRVTGENERLLCEVTTSHIPAT